MKKKNRRIFLGGVIIPGNEEPITELCAVCAGERPRFVLLAASEVDQEKGENEARKSFHGRAI
jgi:hypothetical protein